jgi:hypothetical protein
VRNNVLEFRHRRFARNHEVEDSSGEKTQENSNLTPKTMILAGAEARVG